MDELEVLRNRNIYLENVRDNDAAEKLLDRFKTEHWEIRLKKESTFTLNINISSVLGEKQGKETRKTREAL